MEHVILVDEQDKEVGIMEKMAAHKAGLLHRAFSVLLFNAKGELLLQKRASEKYHSAGLWTNTCCSHPRPGEPIVEAAKRRLKYEMGIDAATEFAFKFQYQVKLESELTEHELDYVLTGTFDGTPSINEDEVAEWKFINLADLKHDMEINPKSYTHWFHLILSHPEFMKVIPLTSNL